MSKTIIYKIEDLKKLSDIIHSLIDKELPLKNIVVALEGDLGAGKTTFIKHFLKDYNVKDVVISPTFILHREYHGTVNGTDKIINHIDFYRLENEYELDELRIKKLVSENSITFIEWADKFKDYLVSLKNETVNIIWLKFNYIDENTRKVEITQL